MNEVFLIGKVISDIEFKFIINSKKKKSIGKFWIEVKREQIIHIAAFNQIADFIYRNVKKDEYVFVYGRLCNNYVIAEDIKILYKQENKF